MTVAQNVGFGLKLRRTKKTTIQERVLEVARMLGLEEMLDRKPATLSGGQRQRVAIGRAIVRDPRPSSMDEPLSNLDAKFAFRCAAELARIHARLRQDDGVCDARPGGSDDSGRSRRRIERWRAAQLASPQEELQVARQPVRGLRSIGSPPDEPRPGDQGRDSDYSSRGLSPAVAGGVRPV